MPAKEEYAQISGRVYARGDNNRVPIPSGWQELDWVPDTGTGFSAGTYKKGNEIVISFTGTNQKLVADFIFANIPLANGGDAGSQLRTAVLYYESVKVAHPGSKITFTGHSLGGGLATLMGVFFKKEAAVFAPAPFRNSALVNGTINLVRDALKDSGIVDPDFVEYFQAAAGTQRLNKYNERRVKQTSYSLSGEILDVLLSPLYSNIAGTRIQIGTGSTRLGMSDLHSIVLHAAFLESSSFAKASTQIPNLLPLMFDTALYAKDPQDVDADINFLDHLYQHQKGVSGELIPDGMLDRFGLDMVRVAELHRIGPNEVLVSGLIKLALQHYYQQNTSQQNLFTSMGGGLQFDLTQPLGDIDTSLADIRAYAELRGYARDLAFVTGPDALAAFESFVTEKRQWTISVSGGAIAGLSQGGVSDLMLGDAQHDIFSAGGGEDLLIGGDGNDYLDGEGGNDRIFGGRGNDVLIGGADNDLLLAGEGSNRLEGGVGFDTYDVLSGGMQFIFDEDGAGQIFLDGNELSGGTLISVNRYVNDDNTITYTFVGDWTTGGVLEISGGLSIRGFHDGDLGIHLASGDTTPAPTMSGRLVVSDDDNPDDINDLLEIANVHILDANGGNGIWIYDNIEVRAGIGNDVVTTTGNNVYLNGGAGNDYLGASTGTDQIGVTIVGGSGTDLIHGGMGAEKLYGEEEKEFQLALEAGASDEGSGLIGDWLSGGGGDDLIVGGAGDDIVYGGAGSNTILGGAGDDHLYGDEFADTSLIYSHDGVYGIELPYGFEFQWGFRQTSMLRNERRQEVPTNASDPITPEGWGNNTIYAGNGDDWVSGGYGDDYIDGGSGDDTLNGDDGANVILGGDGNDYIFSGNYGAQSNGYLDGGEGDDRIVATNGVYLVEGGVGDDFIWVDTASPLMQSNVIHAGEGDDTVWGSFGDDYIEGGDGNDIIFGHGGNDFIRGGGGHDHIEASEGNVQVFGDAGDDVISTIEGFSGGVLSGGAGDDEYQFISGSDTVTLEDNEGNNRIVFLYGEEIEDVEILEPLTIWIEWNGAEQTIVYGKDGIRIRLDVGSNLPSIVVRHVTEYVEGRWIGNDQSVAWDSLYFGQFGTEEADFIEAHPGAASNLAGYAGNDYLIGATGNDTLSGGPGDDLLDGGAGGDLYLISLGEGHDTIADSGASPSDINVLSFGEGIAATDLSVFQTYDDVRLQIGAEDSGNSVTIVGAGNGDAVARVEFFDGMVWSVSTLRSIAVRAPAPEGELPVDPPPLTDASVDAESGPPSTADVGGNDDAASVTDGDHLRPSIVEPPFTILPPPAVAATSSPFANPDLLAEEPFASAFVSQPAAASFGSFNSATESLGNGSLGSGIGASLVAAPSAASAVLTQQSAGAAARGGFTLPGPSGEAPSERTDRLASRARDAGASSSAADPSNADDSPTSTEESAPITQTVRRDPEPGGVGWLAQQTDAPRETAPALTQWAITNALLQFRLAGSDESAAANSSAGFINSPIAGLPGLSELAPLGMGTSGLGSEGARLQSFSGLNEGLVALAA